MISRPNITAMLRPGRARLADERGFTLLATFLVLTVTSLLIAAMFLAVEGDTHISQHDLDSKRAYTAAEAGANAFLYELNQNPNYWESCSNDSLSKTQVPSTYPPEYYSYQVIPANGYTACASNAIASLIDSSTGSLRMEFTGYSGNPGTERTVVAAYRKLTPLDFAWYTVYEAQDSAMNGYSDCDVFYRAGRDPNCNINWITGDNVNGPMYTQDQYLIDGDPQFGRSPSDKIESLAPAPSQAEQYICAGDNCGGLVMNGTAVPNAPLVPLPSDNTQLFTDATNYGQVFNGTTRIQLNGNSANVWVCPTSTASTCCTAQVITTCKNPTVVNLTTTPLIYVNNNSSCNPPQYNPQISSYTPYGCAGDVYVSGSYTTPVTIAAANNIIIDGNLTTTESGGVPTGGAVAGLVANQYIRVMHALGASDYSAACNQDNATDSNSGDIPSSFNNLDIDAAVLALKHSFIVDNYMCGPPLNKLTVNGAIVQNYRGAVGTVGGSGDATTNGTGYLKNYNYDNRLAYLLPPYLFDISTGGWEVDRETLCTPNGGSSSAAC